MSKSNKDGWVYWIHEREFVRLDENVWKIGRSVDWENRVSQYPKGSRVMALAAVSDCFAAEEALLQSFRTNFIVRRDIGREYFEGDAHFVAMEFFNVVSKFVVKRCGTKTSHRAHGDEISDEAGCSDTSDASCAPPPTVDDQEVTKEMVNDVHFIINEFWQAQKTLLAGTSMPLTDLFVRLKEWCHAQPGGMKCSLPSCQRLATMLQLHYGVRVKSFGNGPCAVFPTAEMLVESEQEQAEDDDDCQAVEAAGMETFVACHIEQDASAFFTLKEAKLLYMKHASFTGKVRHLRADLEKHLQTRCYDQKRVGNDFKNHCNVFLGYRLKD